MCIEQSLHCSVPAEPRHLPRDCRALRARSRGTEPRGSLHMGGTWQAEGTAMHKKMKKHHRFQQIASYHFKRNRGSLWAMLFREVYLAGEQLSLGARAARLCLPPAALSLLIQQLKM